MAAAPDPAALQREVAEFQRRLTACTLTIARLPPVALATAARELVYRDGKVALYRYASLAQPARAAPLLIVYALVNRPTMLDLQPDRSMIRGLLAAGIDVYLLDWGYPDRGDRGLTLGDYVNGYLHRAVQAIGAEKRPINLLGVCQGGTLSIAYASLEPERIAKLVTMVTPVDFHTPENLLSKWVRAIDVDALVDTFGNVPGELLTLVFRSLMPFRLGLQKYLALIDNADDPRQLENFLRMEQWICDSPDQAGEAFREFVKGLFQENRLVRGALAIGGRPVDPARITMPVLNVYATEDHLVPPSASQPLRRLVARAGYEELPFDGGHIGIYVSGRARALPTTVAAWLARSPASSRRLRSRPQR
jgi:poly[(R)-3-hydroxyalkanoate] polymerase subunit PhaC